MFSKAIVRPPGTSMVDGLTNAGLGVPDYQRALEQHAAYVDALAACGVEVIRLDPDERYPDSTFVEDVALLTSNGAIITNPGAPLRKGETGEIRAVLKDHFADIEQINEPGTVEAGDVMMVGSHFYIGLSSRTNEQGAQQLIGHLQKHGMSGSTVEMKEMLHLKTGVAYLEDNNLVACGEFLSTPAFREFNILRVEAGEAHAANCIWVNGTVLMPGHCPATRALVEKAGYPVRTLEISEFQKLDGGLSCLSLRF